MKTDINGLLASKKFRYTFLFITGFLLFYSVLGFLVIPYVLSSQASQIGSEKLGRELHIDDVQFNPFSLELNIYGFELKNKDSSTFSSFEHFYVNVNVIQSIADLSLTLDQVTIKHPYVAIERDKQGQFNFSDLLNSDEQKEDEKKSNEEIFPVTISLLSIIEGKLGWEDGYYSKPHREEIYPLSLNIDGLTTLKNKQSQLGFSLEIASGGQFQWQGQLKLNPLSSKGHIKLEKINFQRVWALFLQDAVKFEILNGTELVEADYQLSDTDKGIQLLVNNAQLGIKDFQLSEKGSTDSLISIPAFNLSGISVDLLKKSVEISDISAKNSEFKAWLNKEGEINFQSLFASVSPEKEEPKQTQLKNNNDSKAEQTWQLTIKQLGLDNFAFNFTDNSLATPANIKISAFNFSTSQLTNDLSSTLPINLSLNLNDQGNIKIQGNVIPAPFSSDLDVDIGDIAIKNFQPYISQFARLDIISGLFNFNAKISLQQTPDSPFEMTLKGDSHIDNLVTRDQISNKDFLNWKQLKLDNIAMDLAENKYTIDKIKLDRPYARILIRKDKSINVNDLIINNNNNNNNNNQKEKPVETTTTTKKTEQKKPFFKVAHIEMVNGVSDFSDLSLILPFSAHINQLKGKVNGISSHQNATAKIMLKGRVDGLAPVNIDGKMNLYQGDSELSLDFNSMPLPLVTPYMAEFAGRKIEKGNMSLGLKYKIQKKQLTASNNLLINQLVLGDEVENPDAVSLPLELAIALLEDSDGKIALDVPITGSLEDPEFSVASIVIDALVNVITKIITSPFNAIASLIDSDEDISKISFLAGNTDLSPEQKTKLDGLATALISRPGLNLEIKSTALSQLDWPQLQAEALDQQLVKIKASKLTQEKSKTVLAEHIKLSAEEYQNELADLFIQKFPQLAEKSLFGTPQLIDPSMGDFYQIAKTKLAEIIPPDTHRLHILASARSQNIAKYLVTKGVTMDRLFLLDVDVNPKDKEDETIASTLNLTVN